MCPRLGHCILTWSHTSPQSPASIGWKPSLINGPVMVKVYVNPETPVWQMTLELLYPSEWSSRCLQSASPSEKENKVLALLKSGDLFRYA